MPLSALAEVRKDFGPNLVSREAVQRKIVVSANVAGRDLGGVVEAQHWRRQGAIDPAKSIFVILSVRDREMQVMPGNGFEPVDRELARAGSIAAVLPAECDAR